MLLPFARRAPVEAVPPSKASRRPVLGLALGGGAARGWAHIGVMRELDAEGLAPDIIAGTSSGAVVGGCYAAGKLDDLEDFTRSLTRRRVFGFMDMSFGGSGLIGGGRLRARLEQALGDRLIEDLPIRFAAVAAEIGAGHEIWLTRGPVADAVRASYALPGIFEPVKFRGRWLFDGALVNPLPISVCRALGAQVVLAVNLLSDSTGRGGVMMDPPEPAGFARFAPLEAPEPPAPPRGFFRRNFTAQEGGPPGIAAVMADAFNITQDRIARSRMAGDPPDVLLGARLGKIGMVEFHRASEMIDIGRDAVRRALPDIRAQIGAVQGMA